MRSFAVVLSVLSFPTLLLFSLSLSRIISCQSQSLSLFKVTSRREVLESFFQNGKVGQTKIGYHNISINYLVLNLKWCNIRNRVEDLACRLFFIPKSKTQTQKLRPKVRTANESETAVSDAQPTTSRTPRTTGGRRDGATDV